MNYKHVVPRRGNGAKFKWRDLKGKLNLLEYRLMVMTKARWKVGNEQRSKTTWKPRSGGRGRGVRGGAHRKVEEYEDTSGGLELQDSQDVGKENKGLRKVAKRGV